jgi:energy-coupling factor transport system ATP-binding protein
MHKGEVYRKGVPGEIFADPEGLIELGLDVPEVVKFQQKFEKAFSLKLEKTCLTMEQLTEAIAGAVKRGEAK